MTDDTLAGTRDDVPGCTRQECPRAAGFWLYQCDSDGWEPLCERHTRDRHPSLEIHAWLESGYAKPVELAKPTNPPTTPQDPRTAAFRDLVTDAMNWTE